MNPLSPLLRSLAAPALAALLVALFALPGHGQDARESVGAAGHIDWERQAAVAVGNAPARRDAANPAQARALARRAAMLDAQRNLLEVVGQVRVDSTTVIQNYMTASDRILSTVQGLLEHATVAAERQLADGGFEVTLTVPLSGPLAQEILAAAPPAALPQAQPAQAAPGAALQNRLAQLEAQVGLLAGRVIQLEARVGALERGAPARIAAAEQPPATPAADPAAQAAAAPAPPAPPAPAPALAAAAQAFTGLVVDARGTDFAPSLRPALTAGSERIYPGPAVDAAIAVRRGFVRYYRDLSKAQQSREVGAAPKTVKAASGNPGTLALTTADAELLRQVLAQPGNFLDQCKVVVVF